MSEVTHLYKLGVAAFHDDVPKEAAENLSWSSAQEWLTGWWHAYANWQEVEAVKARNDSFRERWAQLVPVPDPPSSWMPSLWQRFCAHWRSR